MGEVERVERIMEEFENQKPLADDEGEAQCGLGDDTEAEATAAADKNWPVLQPEARHGLAGEIVRLVEPHTEADPAALLVQFLVGFWKFDRPHSLFCRRRGDTLHQPFLRSGWQDQQRTKGYIVESYIEAA